MPNLIKKLGLLTMIVLLFSALGCKKQTPAVTTTTTTATPTTTYSGSKTTTPAATAAPTTAEKETSATPLPFETTTSTTAETITPTATSEATKTTTPTTSITESTNDDAVLKTKAEKIAEIFGTYTNKDKEMFKNTGDRTRFHGNK